MNEILQRLQLADIIDLIGHGTEKFFWDRASESWNLDSLSGLAASISSAQYVNAKMYAASRFPGSHELIDFACAIAPVDGLRLEFGVWSGRTINRIANGTMGKVYGFDSFEGLPQDWRPGFEKGTFLRQDLPQVAPNVELVVGWFDRTLPAFLDEHPGPISLLHVDCDLYSSTQTVFAQVLRRLVPGTVVVFDEYFNYPGWEQHEFKAFQEFVTSYDVRYEYVGYVPSHQQVAARILSIGRPL
ncbi:class I SAM-dependent methyltransferase [Chthonobacter rhizosphaerae]|uniref:class I SAM-dependent methyltransferase n=1 Tax=Chthonobacter rhizosphaerae TaxID=2735553 RepID=UPI0015EE51DC